MTRHVALYIKDILSSMQDAEQFIEGTSYQQFADDKKTFNAVVRAIEVIGEAAKNVPPALRAQYPAIPLREMAGMRDKVTHFYFGVDREAIWLAVKERIPLLRPAIEQILKDLNSAET